MTSTTTDLKTDLAFVTAAIERNQSPGVPAILLLWAVLLPVGFALVDFRPAFAGPYWLIAGIGGGMLSFWLGHRAGQAQGMVNRELGKRHGLHWGSMGLAYILLGASFVTGDLDLSASPLWLLLTAFGYFTAGIHLEDSRGMLPAGAIMFAGYAALVWLPLPFPWTVTGVITSVSLIVAALGARKAG